MLGQDGTSLAYLVNFAGGNWVRLPPAPIAAHSLAGDNSSGLICIGKARAHRPPRQPPPPPPPADTRSPTIEITNLEEDSFRSERSIVVNVRATDEGGIRGVAVNGVAARALGGDAYQATAELTAGENRITAEAYDMAGNCGRVVRTIRVKWPPPELTVAMTRLVVIEGTVDDPTAQVTVEGQPVPVDGRGRFRVQVAVPATGLVRIVAVDRYGLRTERTYTASGQRADDDRSRGRGRSGR